MSILFTLRKFVDPEQHGVEEADHRIERQRPRDEADGAPPAAPAPIAYVCRVCALESADRSYCPACLADTMQPIQKK